MGFRARGIKIPAKSNVQAAAPHMMNPGVKLPQMSLTAPTSSGARNMQKPETVMINPQTMPTFSGVIPGSAMGNDKRVGTYSHEPMPKTAMEA